MGQPITFSMSAPGARETARELSLVSKTLTRLSKDASALVGGGALAQLRELSAASTAARAAASGGGARQLQQELGAAAKASKGLGTARKSQAAATRSAVAPAQALAAAIRDGSLVEKERTNRLENALQTMVEYGATQSQVNRGHREAKRLAKELKIEEAELAKALEKLADEAEDADFAIDNMAEAVIRARREGVKVEDMAAKMGRQFKASTNQVNPFSAGLAKLDLHLGKAGFGFISASALVSGFTAGIGIAAGAVGAFTNEALTEYIKRSTVAQLKTQQFKDALDSFEAEAGGVIYQAGNLNENLSMNAIRLQLATEFLDKFGDELSVVLNYLGRGAAALFTWLNPLRLYMVVGLGAAAALDELAGTQERYDAQLQDVSARAAKQYALVLRNSLAPAFSFVTSKAGGALSMLQRLNAEIATDLANGRLVQNPITGEGAYVVGPAAHDGSMSPDVSGLMERERTGKAKGSGGGGAGSKKKLKALQLMDAFDAKERRLKQIQEERAKLKAERDKEELEAGVKRLEQMQEESKERRKLFALKLQSALDQTLELRPDRIAARAKGAPTAQEVKTAREEAKALTDAAQRLRDTQMEARGESAFRPEVQDALDEMERVRQVEQASVTAFKSMEQAGVNAFSNMSFAAGQAFGNMITGAKGAGDFITGALFASMEQIAPIMSAYGTTLIGAQTLNGALVIGGAGLLASLLATAKAKMAPKSTTSASAPSARSDLQRQFRRERERDRVVMNFDIRYGSEFVERQQIRTMIGAQERHEVRTRRRRA